VARPSSWSWRSASRSGKRRRSQYVLFSQAGPADGRVAEDEEFPATGIFFWWMFDRERAALRILAGS
jgi:hypothetical protein